MTNTQAVIFILGYMVLLVLTIVIGLWATNPDRRCRNRNRNRNRRK